MRNKLKTRRYLLALLLLVLIAQASSRASMSAGAAEVPAPAHLRFRVALAPGLAAQPAAGRLLLFMTTKAQKGELLGLDVLEDPKGVWISGLEVQNMEPGKAVEVDGDAMGFPGPLASAPQGDYQVMALLDQNHSYTYNEAGPGDLYSEILTVKNLTPNAASAPLELTLSKRLPERPLAETDSIKLVEMESPSLTAFWGRPIKMQAGVILPPSYHKSNSERYPVVYVVHGFSSSHTAAWRRGAFIQQQMAEGHYPEMIYVVLNGSCPLGHHEFADSANNGPWGHALTTEFIPYLETKFRMDAKPTGRLLTGHSSGGWSTLWLQVNYPDVFGGTWSTSPDPVDFRNFSGADLTKYPPQNFYHASDGKPYNIVRAQGRETASWEEFARMERVLGPYGGQMASFEAVFSPRGQDGQPMPLYDRDTGRIDPIVQKSWERYDISRLLRNNWSTLGPRLRGKIHVIVGTIDTFHLEAPASLLRDTLKELGSDARFEFVEGRDHFDLYTGPDKLEERIAREIYAIARPGKQRR
ncbi:MAG TPA: alpha/beta hydrolase [Pyrinomonadaceae bacterium]|jgi:enterochelin esterase-like enzyme|nr:alpha/beta hydrolase [Pyrinomonadaceae bacterium]